MIAIGISIAAAVATVIGIYSNGEPLCWLEAHPGTGAWAQALFTAIAIFWTWFLSSAEARRRRREALDREARQLMTLTASVRLAAEEMRQRTEDAMWDEGAADLYLALLEGDMAALNGFVISESDDPRFFQGVLGLRRAAMVMHSDARIFRRKSEVGNAIGLVAFRDTYKLVRETTEDIDVAIKDLDVTVDSQRRR